MTNDDFFASFARSAWRLETLPAYGTAKTDPAFAAYLNLGHLSPLEERPRAQAWLAAVRRATAEGKRIGRVHVLSQPLSDYLRYELATYFENEAAGEIVRIADVSPQRRHASLTRDFWLLDDQLALLMDYDAEGRFLSLTPSRDPAVLRRCRQRQEMALACSVKLQDYLQPA